MNKLEVRISRLKSMNAFRWLLKRAFYSRVRFYRDQMTSIFPACSRLSWRFRENDVWRSEIETSIFLAVIIKPFVIHLVVEKTQSKPRSPRRKDKTIVTLNFQLFHILSISFPFIQLWKKLRVFHDRFECEESDVSFNIPKFVPKLLLKRLQIHICLTKREPSTH